ncbi:indole-3-glycerol phosphate synthase TrpC [Blastopirellula retiformator]|uniref:Indole-3-glycerol phosphate synthase n=1 Tax=Blastopirellula retiformator TaxID=2527970 RepID=A0A5C5V4A6_9BACT|nr:indole-3-glycerol phosphate synthase TrpC [Blastopirellula retiformator]TWT32900.1 Indole-3-glycerol phosphate synthase [Blastopirellula retiformator]
MSTILEKIVATKREEIDIAKAQYPEEMLTGLLDQAPPVRDFFAALTAEGPIKLIAEVKKASPSKGLIREDFNPVEIALAYQAAGATCISCLTDEIYFQGSLDYLRDIRQAVDIPVLRKDFILDPYQLLASRIAGADAVLLIAECLDDEALKTLLDGAHELGMTALVELYEPENVTRVLASGAKLIGVNNRDLRTFEVDLHHTVRLRQQIPADKLLVGESGIFTNDDVQMLASGGVNAILVGESLMRQQDIEVAVKTLLGTN